MIAELTVEATDGAARTGRLRLARREVRTPAFMPVATRGTVRSVATHEVAALSTPSGTRFEVLLANTYHLMLRPGAEVVERLGGLGPFAGWPGPTLTDSGGYQVFSLSPKVSDQGAEFASTYDGTRILLTPELAVAEQERIGADVQMVLDVCPALPAPIDELRRAVDTTEAWARRALAVRTRTEDQSIFGIVQGGVDPELRREAAERTVALGFDGYALGGLSVGESRSEMLPAIDAAVAALPTDRPRYLMGVGDPVSLVEAVARGVDLFDCVLPTRLARHGTLLTDRGRLNIGRAEFTADTAPIQDGCGCPTCSRYERGYLRHLVAVDEQSAATLCTLHNLWWVLRLVERVRESIVAGTLGELRREVAAGWEAGPPA